MAKARKDYAPRELNEGADMPTGRYSELLGRTVKNGNGVTFEDWLSQVDYYICNYHGLHHESLPDADEDPNVSNNELLAMWFENNYDPMTAIDEIWGGRIWRKALELVWVDGRATWAF